MGNYSCMARNRLELSGQVGRDEETKAYSMLYVQCKYIVVPMILILSNFNIV